MLFRSYTVGLTQKNIASACLGHRSTQLRPNAAIEKRENGACHPREQALGTAHGSNDEWDDDEGADADHKSHVQRGRFDQPQAPFEFFGFAHRSNNIRAEKNGKHNKKIMPLTLANPQGGPWIQYFPTSGAAFLRLRYRSVEMLFGILGSELMGAK